MNAVYENYGTVVQNIWTSGRMGTAAAPQWDLGRSPYDPEDRYNADPIACLSQITQAIVAARTDEVRPVRIVQAVLGAVEDTDVAAPISVGISQFPPDRGISSEQAPGCSIGSRSAVPTARFLLIGTVGEIQRFG